MKKKNYIKKCGTAGKLVMLLILTSFLVACGTYGRLKKTHYEPAAVKNPEIVAGYKYFYDGRESMPYSVIGIKDTYVFNSRFWTPIDTHAGDLGKLVYRIGSPLSSYFSVYRILDPDGNQIGVLYTSELLISVKFGPGNQVSLEAPYSHGSHPSIVEGGK